MAGQNINQYNYPKLFPILKTDTSDMSLTSDELDFNQEVVFSPYLIAETYGDRLPINFDLNNNNSSQNITLDYKVYNPNNILISQNYYNPKDLDLSCLLSGSSCDIGLTGIDNGLVTQIEGQTLNYTNGLFTDAVKFDRMYYDRRMKFIQTTTNVPDNHKFSGIPEYTAYEMVSKNNPQVGRYVEL